MQSLRVATCQFPVEADIAGNLRFTLRQIRRAAEQGAWLEFDGIGPATVE